jgi:hypothetical protein
VYLRNISAKVNLLLIFLDNRPMSRLINRG